MYSTQRKLKLVQKPYNKQKLFTKTQPNSTTTNSQCFSFCNLDSSARSASSSPAPHSTFVLSWVPTPALSSLAVRHAAHDYGSFFFHTVVLLFEACSSQPTTMKQVDVHDLSEDGTERQRSLVPATLCDVVGADSPLVGMASPPRLQWDRDGGLR